VFTVGRLTPIVFDTFVVKFKVSFEIDFTFPLFYFMVDFKSPLSVNLIRFKRFIDIQNLTKVI
jgi:hypothetical protein